MKLTKNEVKALNEIPAHLREFVVDWIKNDRAATFHFNTLIRAENKILQAFKSLIVYDEYFTEDAMITRRHYNVLLDRAKRAHKATMRNDRRNSPIEILDNDLFFAILHVVSAERRAKTGDKGKYG